MSDPVPQPQAKAMPHQVASPSVPMFYVDSAVAGVSSYAMVVTFGQLVQDETGKFVGRTPTLVLQMSPPFAKVLAHLLSSQVATYEAKLAPMASVDKLSRPEGT